MDTPPPERNQSAEAESSSKADGSGAVKDAKTRGEAEHPLVPAKHTGGTARQLLETPNDITSLERLGPDRFEATLRSGKIRRGDAELLKTLPQGEAKLATLETRERQYWMRY